MQLRWRCTHLAACPENSHSCRCSAPTRSQAWLTAANNVRQPQNHHMTSSSSQQLLVELQTRQSAPLHAAKTHFGRAVRRSCDEESSVLGDLRTSKKHAHAHTSVMIQVTNWRDVVAVQLTHSAFGENKRQQTDQPTNGAVTCCTYVHRERSQRRSVRSARTRAYRRWRARLAHGDPQSCAQPTTTMIRDSAQQY